MLRLTGANNEVMTAEGASVIIKTLKGQKVIPIANIQSCDLQYPKTFKNGALVFGMAKGSSAFVNVGMGVMAGTSGDIYFWFKKDNLSEAEQIKEYIANYSASNFAQSAADEITKYKKLQDDGIITEEEFATKKKQLLGL